MLDQSVSAVLWHKKVALQAIMMAPALLLTIVASSDRGVLIWLEDL